MLYGYDDPTENARNGDGLGVQFTSGSANNITIRNMEIFDNGVYDTFSGGYNSDSKGIQPMGSDLTFERLLVHDNGQDDFQTGGSLSNVTIQDSWIYERRSNPLYPGFSFNSAPHLVGCTHVDGIQVYGGGVQSGLTFKNDIFGPLLGQDIYPSDTGTYFNNVSINNVLLIDATENNVNSDPQSSGGPQNWSVQNITAYQVPGGAEPGWNTNLGIYSGTSNMSLTNSIVDNGNVQLPGFTGSGNINYNSDPVPGSTTTNPLFVGPLPSTNTPNYDTLVAMNFTPQCSLCNGIGSALHSVQDLLNDIDQLNSAQTSLTPTSGNSATPTSFPINTPTPTLIPNPTFTPTPTPSPTTAPLTQGNLIKNSSFENTGSQWLSPWIFQKTSRANATISQSTSSEDGSYAALVTVNKNTRDWYVQLMQANLVIVAGKTYTISFWARTGANNSSANVVLQADHGSYPIYLQKYMSLNTAWQKFTYTYTANISDTNADLGFNLGANSGNYYIDNVSMISN